MFKKGVSIFLIISGLMVLWVSTSRQAMAYITAKRDVNKWWGTYQCLNGDLVSMSYLDFIKKFNPGPDTNHLEHTVHAPSDNTVLYIHGDSYTWHLGDSNFAGVSSLIYINRDHGCNYHLDSTKRNILIIEISERFVWDYFSTLRMFDEVCDSVIKKKSITCSYPESQYQTNEAGMFPAFSVDDLFNKYINQNLQCNLFNYQFIMPMFESKAALNYYVFNRASGDVVISKDRNSLFLKKTVSSDETGSSYAPVSAGQVIQLIENFNLIYDHYTRGGFSEVYLSIIPNSATMEQPDGYNYFIPTIQNDPRLRMKVIDIYSVFKASPAGMYWPGDTHWYNKGKQKWLDLVNATLASPGNIHK
jgi:hypothetical protein